MSACKGERGESDLSSLTPHPHPSLTTPHTSTHAVHHHPHSSHHPTTTTPRLQPLTPALKFSHSRRTSALLCPSLRPPPPCPTTSPPPCTRRRCSTPRWPRATSTSATRTPSRPRPTRASRGKQFQTNPSKGGQLAGFFSPFAYATDSYADSNKYILTQPRDARKLGFGTHDANRRDEFTLDIRAKQYRQLMAQEKAWEKAYIQRRGVQSAPAPGQEGEGKDALDRLTDTFQTQIPRLQFDIGRDGGGGDARLRQGVRGTPSTARTA